MRTFLLSLLVSSAALAQTSDAGYPPLPGTKVDNYISTVPANQTVRAAEFNNFVQNVQQVENQLSGAVQNYVALSSDAGLCTIDDLMVGPTATTHCASQVSGGLTVQGATTLDGGAYVNGNMVVDGGHTVIGNLVVNGNLTVNGGNNVGGRQTAIDCNFVTAPLQLLSGSTGGTTAICVYPDGGSITWTTSAANLGTSGAVDSGLIMSCSGTGGSGLPGVDYGIYTPLSAAIPNFNGTTPFCASVWIQNPTTTGGAAQYEAVSIDNAPLVQTKSGGSSVTESGSIAYRGNASWLYQLEPVNITGTANDSSIGTGYNEAQICYPNGLDTGITSMQVVTYDGGLPSIGGEFPISWGSLVTINSTGAQQAALGQSQNFNLYLSCIGTAATTNFGRVKLDYRP